MNNFNPVIPIASLGLHPGKSMRFVGDVQTLEFDEFGLFGDRAVMFVEATEHVNTNWRKGNISDVGSLITQREDSVLTQVVPTINSKTGIISLRLDNASGLETRNISLAADTPANHIPISVWGWKGIGVDLGDELADFGEEVIGRPVRLVGVSKNEPRFVESNKKLGRVGFADSTPLLITSVGSINAVNAKLRERGKDEIPLNRWRANIVLDCDEPWIEDRIASITFEDANGEQLIAMRLKACGRCPVPDTDQLTGATGHDVRSALGKLGRNGIHSNTTKYGSAKELFFGQGFVIRKNTTPFDLSVGNLGIASLTTHPNWIAPLH